MLSAKSPARGRTDAAAAPGGAVAPWPAALLSPARGPAIKLSGGHALSTALIGHWRAGTLCDAAVRSAQRVLDPPIAAVTGAGTLLQLHRASQRSLVGVARSGSCSTAPSTAHSSVDADGMPEELSAGLLGADRLGGGGEGSSGGGSAAS